MWPDYQDAVVLFFAMDTQWRWLAGAMKAVRVGLDYAVLEQTARGLGIEWTPQIFTDIQTLERAALKALRGD